MNDRTRIREADGHGLTACLDGSQPGHELNHLRVVCGIPQLVVDRGAADGVLSELLIKLINGIGRVGTVRCHGPLCTCTVPIPYLHFSVPRAHEEHEAFLGTRGIDHGHRVSLVKAGQKEEV